MAALFPNNISETKALMEPTPANGIAGHAVGILKDYQPGEKYVYYFGSAWSKNDVRTLDEWKLRIDNFLNALHSPLEVHVK